MKGGDIVICIKNLQMFTYDTNNTRIPTNIAAFKDKEYTLVNDFCIINELGNKHDILTGTDFFKQYFKPKTQKPNHMNQKLTLPGITAHFEIEQGTEDWWRLKYGKVGGKLSAALLGDPQTLINHIGSCHLEPFELEDEGYVNAEMQRGIDLEPHHRLEISEYAGVEFLKCGWLQNEDIPGIGISPDGITADLTISWEGKCPGKSKHAATLYGGVIPIDNAKQCVHYFSVNKHLVKHYFSSWRPECEHPLFVRELTLDTVVNLGTPKTPVNKTVRDWVEIYRSAAIVLQENVKIYNQKLQKI